MQTNFEPIYFCMDCGKIIVDRSHVCGFAPSPPIYVDGLPDMPTPLAYHVHIVIAEIIFRLYPTWLTLPRWASETIVWADTHPPTRRK